MAKIKFVIKLFILFPAAYLLVKSKKNYVFFATDIIVRKNTTVRQYQNSYRYDTVNKCNAVNYTVG
ncbi:hypothetical protein DSM106972_044210 [Dulcicalothrix desertica PCC 7102]|uniref:Uncharacterized protein n=1 Tax=Dulcicalothrix desertica PCC 7102 TaxID=232991 RepID=A0A433VFH0_9CYAN|nr:hypothetical protein DSM106972_044210 [Dulcicalothrix desertica PCC 7102]